jgi:non-ribosomal peptide synthetase component F
VVALLAVARSGAAWLPLDPRFPADRLGFMLQDSQARMVLTQSTLEPMLRDTAQQAGLGDLQLLALDTAWDAPPAEPQRRARPEHLAYVIYTSGSTGRPKGVMVPTRRAMPRCYWRKSSGCVPP